jgi:hypothetical protein
VVAVAGAGAAAYLALVDPNRGGIYPACPLHAATDLWCPGCGMTRAAHALLTGDVAGALGANLFLPVVVLLVGWAWLAWAWPVVPKLRVVPTWAWWTLAAAVVLFTLARNLPLDPLRALAP